MKLINKPIEIIKNYKDYKFTFKTAYNTQGWPIITCQVNNGDEHRFTSGNAFLKHLKHCQDVIDGSLVGFMNRHEKLARELALLNKRKNINEG